MTSNHSPRLSRSPIGRSRLVTAALATGLLVTSAATTALALAPSASGRAPAAQPMQANDGRDGKYKSEDEHAKDVRWLLLDVADRAANDNGPKRCSDWLSSKDRHRIVDGLKSVDTKGYDAEANEFRRAWRKRYKNEFSAHRYNDQLYAQKITFRDEGGRKFCIVGFPAFGGMQAYEMRLQLEAKDRWRIEVPNEVDAQQFTDSLLNALRNIVKRQDSLFEDESLGLNSVVTQMLSGMSFEPGKTTASKKK